MFGLISNLAGVAVKVATRPLLDGAEIAHGLVRGEVRLKPIARMAGASLLDDTLATAIDVVEACTDGDD